MNSSVKKVTYKDQMDRKAKKAKKRQKNTADALAAFRRALTAQGEGSNETISALEVYVEKCCETSVYLLDMGHYDDSGKALADCLKVLKRDIKARYPAQLYKVYYRQAQLMNAKELH